MFLHFFLKYGQAFLKVYDLQNMNGMSHFWVLNILLTALSYLKTTPLYVLRIISRLLEEMITFGEVFRHSSDPLRASHPTK